MSAPDRCQYCYEELVGVSVANAKSPKSALLQRYLWAKGIAWYLIKLGPFSFISKMLPRMRSWRRILGTRAIPSHSRSAAAPAKLKAGDLVKVKSAAEILDTLDEKGKLRGLLFTPEMVKFAGRQFRVYKVLRRIILETNGQLRTIRTPTVLLDGAICDGSAHGGCDRSCFCFWREEWLRRAPSTT